jgi:hypothetical protein
MKNFEKIFLIITSMTVVATLLLGFALYLRIGGFSSNSNIDGCAPYGIEINSLDTSRVEVIWKTDAKCMGFVKYGSSLDDLSFTATSSEGSSVKEQSAIISNLRAGFKYYLLINSGTKQYGANGLPIPFEIKQF